VDRDLAPAVRCRAEFSACDHPVKLEWRGSSVEIAKIIKEWREPGSKSYLVEVTDGSHFKLTFLEIGGKWLVNQIVIK
jgi:6-phosphogluconate dehydrogenase